MTYSSAAQAYWDTHDAVNELARALRPSLSGAVDAAGFLKRAQELPGYANYTKNAFKFQEWLADQRQATVTKRPGARMDLTSSFPDPSGQRMQTTLDLAKVEAYFRTNLDEFGKILLS